MGLKHSAADELRKIVNFVNFASIPAVGHIVSCPWASITFSGERHRVELTFGGPDAGAAADTFLDGLSEREFPLRGHILIDIACVRDTRGEDYVRLTLEALTVEED